jgi:hypothetical protein
MAVPVERHARVHRAVPDGPRAYRSRIRRRGPLLAVLPAAVLGVAALAMLHGSTTTSRGVGGFLAAVLAAPAMLCFGVPLATGSGPIVSGVLVSALAWLTIGIVAARRATRSPVASWRDYAREWAWLAAGVWLGVFVALGAIRVAVGRLVV